MAKAEYSTTVFKKTYGSLLEEGPFAHVLKSLQVRIILIKR